MKFWDLGGGDLQRHIDAHKRSLGSDIIIGRQLGDKSANFDLTILIPPNDGYTLRKLHICNDTTFLPNPTAYWSFLVYENSEDDMIKKLIEWDGTKRGLQANQLSRSPVQTDLEIPLSELPIRIRGTKTGAPAALTDLYVQITLGLR